MFSKMKIYLIHLRYQNENEPVLILRMRLWVFINVCWGGRICVCVCVSALFISKIINDDNNDIFVIYFLRAWNNCSKLKWTKSNHENKPTKYSLNTEESAEALGRLIINVNPSFALWVETHSVNFHYITRRKKNSTPSLWLLVCAVSYSTIHLFPLFLIQIYKYYYHYLNYKCYSC